MFISEVAAIGRPLDDRASLGRTLDDLLAGRTEPPTLLALGEPTHGVAAFPELRNDLLGHLVDRGYRSIALETDVLAASVVDDYVHGATADLDTVLATGFSHGFGAVPGNRELVTWLRAHNAGRAPQDRVRFHGFDAPVEYAGAPSPRHALSTARDHLPVALWPETISDLDALVGEETDWTHPDAMFDPTASIGDSDRAHALRVVADDLADVLRRAAPGLRAVDPTGHDHAVAHARTALGLLRFHAAMARPGDDRLGSLLSARAEMMADNLLAIVAREKRRGPSLVFAHNAHLQRGRATWGNAGALVALSLGEQYVVLATDANPHSQPGTLQSVLAAATTRRTLFPAPALRDALPAGLGRGEPMLFGHIPLDPAELDGCDAVVFIADTDGAQHRYWEAPVTGGGLP